ncbi:hypothetical protein ACQZV8_13435 [Magnetococcales bacterium HHB-1]
MKSTVLNKGENLYPLPPEGDERLNAIAEILATGFLRHQQKKHQAEKVCLDLLPTQSVHGDKLKQTGGAYS